MTRNFALRFSVLALFIFYVIPGFSQGTTATVTVFIDEAITHQVFLKINDKPLGIFDGNKALKFNVDTKKTIKLEASLNAEKAPPMHLEIDSFINYCIYFKQGVNGPTLTRITDEKKIRKLAEGKAVEELTQRLIEQEKAVVEKKYEPKRDFTTVVFSRTKGGTWGGFGGAQCGLQIKFPNQEHFNVNAGEEIEYHIYSEGKFSVTAELYPCQMYRSTILSLDAEPGKFIFVKAGGSGQDLIAFNAEADTFSYYAKRPKTIIEENADMPINFSGKQNRKGSGMASGSGSGFLLSSQGYIVTNHHVIDKAGKITVRGIGGDFSTPFAAEVVLKDETNDLAILKLKTKNIKFDSVPYTFRRGMAETGEDIFVLGFPKPEAMGSEVKLTTGIISAQSGYQGSVTAYQVSAAVQPGNSGGPLFDKNGNLIGIVFAKIAAAENVSYGIKAAYLKALLEMVPEPVVLNTVNSLSGLPLNEQVKRLKEFVYLIETEK